MNLRQALNLLETDPCTTFESPVYIGHIYTGDQFIQTQDLFPVLKNFLSEKSFLFFLYIYFYPDPQLFEGLKEYRILLEIIKLALQ